jgi:hypothetical protein
MSAATRILDRLDAVRETGPGRWRARCPAHDDKRPSLDIRDSEGLVLLCCRAGCSTEDVVLAVGLELRDLFDRPAAHCVGRVRDPMRSHVDAADVLASIQHEALVVAIVAERIARGASMPPEDGNRLIRAASIINAAVARTMQREPAELRRMRRGESRP